MIESDHSETEIGDMDRLRLSSDSIDNVPKKRPRVEESEAETDLPKKRQCSFTERSEMLENVETISEKNNTDGCYAKEENYELCPGNQQNVQEVSLSESNGENKGKEGGDLKEGNGKEDVKDENDIALNKNPGEINIKEEIVENMDNSSLKPVVTNASAMSIPENEKERTEGNEVKEKIDKTTTGEENNEEDEIKKRRTTTKKRTVDTEVVDGLELSVECASDKEESSSESEDEKDAKPRPRTIIVKAEPNESELDCSSEEEEKPDSHRIVDTVEIELERSRMKRKGTRTSFSKLKTSGSEDSQNSNSDEDYSPRTKKKIIKSPTTRKSNVDKRRSVESKRGRGRDVRRKSRKKNIEYVSDDTEDTTAAERASKTTKTKNELEKELSDEESLSKNESDDNSDKEERSIKSRRGRHGNASTKPQDKRIKMLKKYLKIAGVKVKSYNDIWADCKSSAAKIKRLKELLEKNGISGRPTLEKCKRVKEENEKMREVSELDTSNIISEGRITRARRNMNSVKKTLPDTPPRHREARNTFRRIQTVVDSDSE